MDKVLYEVLLVYCVVMFVVVIKIGMIADDVAFETKQKMSTKICFFISIARNSRGIQRDPT
ncbi:MAG: hypothetical protein ACI8RD_012748 [Bacillariaceae sp.]|jgi:hypothetical protein